MAAVFEKIQSYMEQYMKSWPFSGTILIAQNNNIVFKSAYGFANHEHQIRNQLHTKFGIWSITKSFTAMAIMQLVEQKMLRLDDSLDDYLPQFKKFEKITIKHLLQHESGLANFTNLPEFNANLNKWPINREKWIPMIIDLPLDFSPGTSFSYNNTGYFLLGIIIEKVSGITYEQYVTTHFLEPLDMLNTGLNDGRRVISGLASSYDGTEQSLSPSEFIDMSTCFSAGSMYSTVEDLYKWDQALYTGKFISQETIQNVFYKDDAKYGLGWFLDNLYDRKRVFHGGAYRGYRSELHRYPEDKTTVILLTNFDFVPATSLADSLAGLVFDKEITVPEIPLAISLDEEKYNNYMGTYEGFGCKAVVQRDGDQLFFVWNDRELVPFYPISESTFHHKTNNKTYMFKQRADGTLSFLGMKKVK
ncbi:beta-lactamase family protein [Paenibacillus sp. GSMTC-2017]|uniref:serine hydrolase domain-containing protein n=1 Tax=Paenibacillus sp. GSMTC-2017 TaxID=2794350 RepID=UPI0018D8BCBF|nr:serine hydrolase domain-containing protein [Paenibacillus sp. GSMTC-2017]MBH5317870.1 beta-lactamase family protein [Paenibacillus sp. GSMTC-2017]